MREMQERDHMPNAGNHAKCKKGIMYQIRVTMLNARMRQYVCQIGIGFPRVDNMLFFCTKRAAVHEVCHSGTKG